MSRISDHITRVEVHLSDENGDKDGQNDMRCMMEARLEGRQPIAVTHQAATLDEAVERRGGQVGQNNREAPLGGCAIKRVTGLTRLRPDLEHS